MGRGPTVEAYSEDGLIEAISVTDYKAFGVGVQWHAEFHPEREENKLNKILLKNLASLYGVSFSKAVSGHRPMSPIQAHHNRKSKKITRQFCAELLFYGTKR